MNALWIEFGTVALAHALAVASPGPDFVLVLRQSMRSGRSAAVASSIGIGCGILVHVSYSLLGLAALVRHQPQVFAGLKIVGALYLAWLGVGALRAKAGNSDTVTTVGIDAAPGAQRRAWLTGFLTNLLNPKATLFFVALFTLAISPQTPASVQVAYGIWMALATMGWFSVVALMFTQPRVRSAYLRGSVWIDRALGIVFLGFAASLLWT